MTGPPKEVHMYQPAADIDEDDINLGDLIGVLIENRWLILAVIFVAFLVGSYSAYTAVPVYRADGVIQVEEKAPGLANLETSYMLEEFTMMGAEIEILRSRSLLGNVVDNLQLDVFAYPEFGSDIGRAIASRAPEGERPLIRVDALELPDSMRGESMRLVLVAPGRFDLYGAEESLLLRGQVGEPVTADLSGDETISLTVSRLQGETDQAFWVGMGTRQDSIAALQGRLTVMELGDWSGVLSIQIDGGDPESVRRQVNELADVYVQQNVDRKSEEAAKTIAFLDNQLPLIRQDVERAELALNNFRLEKGSIDLPAETQAILQTIVSIEAQLNELQQEREKVRLSFTEIHPTIVAIDRQVGRLNGEISELNVQVRDLPTTQQELLRLIRDLEVNTTLYTSLLDTAQELRVVKAGTVGNVRVIDYAVTPSGPIAPNRSRIVMLALILGGFVGVALAFARKALKTGVEDPDVVEKRVNIPIYATISHSRRQEKIFKKLKSEKAKRAILAVDTPDDPAIESLRNLLTALHFGMMNVKNNCIMIAGPSPEVGKSFVSVNLAAVLTSTDKKVLLIDADLRRGHLNEYLGVERENGLSEFISGEISIGEVLHQTSVPGLTLIPTGTLPPNPTELLLHQRFSNCLSVLTPRYDHIIIDSPPILAAADASIIGQMAGGTLMVLKSGMHPMREIEQAVKRLQQAEVNLRGILFNDIVSHSRSYGAGKYDYQYSYKNN